MTEVGDFYFIFGLNELPYDLLAVMCFVTVQTPEVFNVKQQQQRYCVENSEQTP